MFSRHIHVSVRLPSLRPAKRRRASIYNVISLLLHHAEVQQLTMRRDGYVCVQDLLCHPQLHGITFWSLEDIIKTDKRQTFQLLYEPSHPATLSPAGSWWIRVNQSRSPAHVEVDLQRILKVSEIPMAVHGTTFEAWKLIAKQGLSRMGGNYIHLAQGEGGACITNGILDSSQVLIYIDVARAMQAGIKFYLASSGTILTRGNENGFLEPSYFKKAEMIRVRTNQICSMQHVKEEQNAEGTLREPPSS
ncbi:hypothetical protein AX15_007429 [Amanita polypyramis BW_CC]|nr:hypothetical protein AX15_007429 [Amanita polypyramis BW_CC]